MSNSHVISIAIVIFLICDIIMAIFTRADLAFVYVGLAVCVISVLLYNKRNRKLWEHFGASLVANNSNEIRQPESRLRYFGAFFAGFLSLIAGLIYLQSTSPFYFTQDDNFAQFGPVMAAAAKGFHVGDFPTWNPDLMLGMPITAAGTYALTYPLVYLSYELAIFLLRDPNATIEILCVLHVVLGYIVCYSILGRHWRFDPWLAAAGSLVYVFSGFTLIAGRSWYYMVLLVVWVPIVFYASWRFLEAPGKATSILMGAAIGCFYHAGNAQMWFYALFTLFVLVMFLWLNRGISPTHFRYGAVAVAIIALLDGPLLFTQMHFVSDVPRISWGGGFLKGMIAMFLPYPLTDVLHPNGSYDGKYSEYMTEIYYMGSIHVLVGFLAVAAMCSHIIRRYATFDKFTPPMFAFVSVVLVIDAGFGSDSMLGQILAVLPIFNLFTNPYKFLGLLTFFTICLGTWGLEIFAKYFGSQRRFFPAGIFGASVILSGWHLFHVHTSFHTYGDHGYPDLPPEAENLLKNSKRIATVAPWRSAEPGYLKSLPQNFAAAYGISQVGGYLDKLVSSKPESVDLIPPSFWRVYGVDTVLFSLVKEQNLKISDFVQKYNLKLIFEDSAVQMYSLSGAEPLVDAQNVGGTVENFERRQDGLNLRVVGGTRAGQIMINYIFRDGIRAFVDDVEVVLSKDLKKRMLLNLGPGSHDVKIRYGGLWRFGYLQVFILSCAMIWIFATIVLQPSLSRLKK